jgi:hypothetical protein
MEVEVRYSPLEKQGHEHHEETGEKNKDVWTYMKPREAEAPMNNEQNTVDGWGAWDPSRPRPRLKAASQDMHEICHQPRGL